ncbi:hypothetical protein EGW08_014078 [Elysia chlorotica]|uniref:FAM20 C-terminal domain-containing protein n=1 Tax=Elysia chlorotica TaxID=188477 RepID=A0A3S1HF90_ELYCH|nr:hypothetical protein EGW08_014078 [Elysia chlorotica]
MKMRRKWRFIFVSAALFVIIVSYKILEPELFKNKDSIPSGDLSLKEPFERSDRVQDKDNQENDGEDQREIQLNEDHREAEDQKKEAPQHHVDVNEVVESMAKRFSLNFSYPLDTSPWRLAASWVTPRQIHPENAKELGAILKAMHEGKITQADVGHRGTQLKLTLVLDGKQKVVFKPAWYTRDYIVEGPPYAGRDRHNAEIAAFHLGRLNLLLSDEAPCFYGRCLYCKGPEDGVCAGSDGVLEGVLVLWMPEHFHLKLHRHPWGRTYRDGKLARWETDNTYCAQVQAVPTYSRGPRLLDIVDTAVLDFLVGNADRHHYETVEEGGRDAALVILDNGKSFGNPDHDEMSILAPLYQCCQIRASLWQRLLALQEGVLSRVLASVLGQDPIAPILTDRHLSALDRRLGAVLDQIGACVDRVGIKAIVVDSSNGSSDHLKKDKRNSGVTVS